MQVEFRTKDTRIESGRRAQIERRLSFVLSRFGGLIRRVVVRIEEMDGPLGGLNKRCHIQAHLTGRHTIVAEVRDVDLDPAIIRAASRLTRRLRDRLSDIRPRRGMDNQGVVTPGVTWVSDSP